MTASRRANRHTAVWAVALAVVVTSCTGDDGATEPSASAVEVATSFDGPLADPVGAQDGVLRIGLLLPETGAGAQLGTGLRIAAQRAVEEINVSGGVNGRAIELVHADEGESPASATSAASTLLEDGVDAIVGPASSNLTLATLGEIVDAGVVACSPTATAMSLDRYPDDGLFFRTIASDRLLAAAIADVAGQTGANTATLMYLDDDYGRPLGQLAGGLLEAGGVELVDQIPFTREDSSYTDEVTQVVNGPDAGVLILVADPESGARVLSAIGASVLAEDPPNIVVNGPMRHPVPADAIANLPDDVREQVQGVAQLARPTDADVEPVGPFATNAFDCVNLIALAALQAGSAAASDFADQIAPVSYQGGVCTTFAACATLIGDGRNVDYNGPNGSVEVVDGETTRGRFDVFGFDEAGVDTSQRSIIITG